MGCAQSSRHIVTPILHSPFSILHPLVTFRTIRFRNAISFYGIALIILGVMTTAFVLLADAVLRNRLLELNRWIMESLHANATPLLDLIALGFTWLGSTLGVTILSIPFAIFLLRRGRVVDLIAFATAVLGSVGLTQVLKGIFATTRPELFPRLEEVASHSFPSGHTFTSFCLWGFMAFWLVREGPHETWRWTVAAGMLMTAALVGASRVYIGVHWPTDVAGGILLATIWIVTCLVGERKARTGLNGE